jgi:hypothetical protein
LSLRAWNGRSLLTVKVASTLLSMRQTTSPSGSTSDADHAMSKSCVSSGASRMKPPASMA